MIRELILRQKFEKERFITSDYIEREKIDFAKRWLESDLVKVIIGPRRAGKSVFAFMLLKDRPFIYLNFDDEIFGRLSQVNPDEIMKELHAVYGGIKTILLDEIQNLPNWELFVNRLKREGYNLIVTGSNANLLSKELATVLTGRHIPIEIMPFNFKEFLLARNYKIDYELMTIPQKKGEILNLVEKYLIEGGFPEVVVKNLNSEEYLSILFDSILFKDVVKRYKVRFSSQIVDLASYLVNNFSGYYSLRKLKEVLSLRSVTTVEKYIKYLEDAYLVFYLERFSYKTGEKIKSPKKVYMVDNGYINAKAIMVSPNKGKLMENMVFTELVKKGLKPNIDLFYYKTRNSREVDFVIKKDLKVTELIQVSWNTYDVYTEQRELKSLLEASEELDADLLTILTWDEEKQVEKNGKVIRFVPIWRWFLL
ncbi:MAG: ATP-binding protein [Caldisericaceae bacterium]